SEISHRCNIGSGKISRITNDLVRLSPLPWQAICSRGHGRQRQIDPTRAALSVAQGRRLSRLLLGMELFTAGQGHNATGQEASAFYADNFLVAARYGLCGSN